MNINDLQIQIDKGLTQREIATHFNVAQITIRYWLKKFNLSTNPKVKKGFRSKPYLCKECGETDKNNFYSTRKECCKKCSNKNMSYIFIDKKLKAIEYKGGKCEICGYNKFYGALEFHHINPNEKEYNWTKLRLHNWNTIKIELDKCMLLCANCHREIHSLVV